MNLKEYGLKEISKRESSEINGGSLGAELGRFSGWLMSTIEAAFIAAGEVAVGTVDGLGDSNIHDGGLVIGQKW